ncbi:DNA gyrase subunit A [bioreactor metagenome]|uniref:DNA gyrase subunit A n=1 Tax=bioreactor metagenome TaxID=1076179 RepID=A0A645EIR5_9ZZZZ
MESDEKVNAMLHFREFEQDAYLVMVTRNGTVKRMELAALKNIRNVGIRALRLDEGDSLISVQLTDGTRNILIATHRGMAICFRETDVRSMGRDATGVRGIRLRAGDFVVGAVQTGSEGCLLMVTENGYGKRTPIQEYVRGDGEPQYRGGYGLKGYNVTEKTGPIAGIRMVEPVDDVLLISDDGVIIRMAAETVNIYSRTAQGVILMRLGEGVKVISLALTEREETDETMDEPGETELPDAPEQTEEAPDGPADET